MAGQTPGSAAKGIKKIFATSLTETADYDKEGVGCLRFEGNSVYKWVKYKEGTAALDIAKGDVLFYDDYDANEVTADRSDTDGIGAGIAQAAVTATNQYMWIRVKGEQQLAVAVGGTSPAVGNAVTTTLAADKAVTKAAAVTDHIVGVVTDLTASANKIICDFPF